MKIIRMTPDAIRAWKTNVSHLIDDQGVVYRPLSNDEDKAISAVVALARKSRKTEKRVMTMSNGGVAHAIEVEVVIKRTGRNDSEYLVGDTYVSSPQKGRYRYVSGREVIAAQLLAKHGECQLRHPNGTIIKVIRDLSTHRPTFKESLQTAPRPENCSCASWGNPHPGVHYATCPWNRLAPPDEQAPAPPTEAELAHLPPIALASLARKDVIVSTPDSRQVTMEAEPLDSPEECRNGCLSWAVPEGRRITPGQHHPTCLFFMKWKQKTSQEREFWLVDLLSGMRVRQATQEEVGESDVAHDRTGSRVIQIDDVPYAVTAAADTPEREQLTER